MPVTILSNDGVSKLGETVRQAGEVFASGGLVVFPTETVYGIAAAAANTKGYEALRAYKGRPTDQPFTLHIPDRDAASRYIDTTDPLMSRLVRKLFPGPVTIVVHVTDELIAAKMDALGMPLNQKDRLYHRNTVGLRCPDHPLGQEILASVDGPVVATSANERGQAPPTTVEAAAEAVGDAADLIIDGGRCQYSKPSTIVVVESTPQGPRYRVERAGVYDERFIRKLMRFNILFVCTGNTCRSPMAEALAKQMLADQKGIPIDELENAGVRVTSVGTFAAPGSPATPEAVDAVAALGVDLNRHRSRPLTVDLIQEADVIYCMTEAHREMVVNMLSSARDKTMTLDPAGDIDDPIGAGPEVYKQSAAQIRQALIRRLKEQQL